MQSTFKFFTLAFVFTTFMACNSDDDGQTPLDPIESKTISNLPAPQEGVQGQPAGGPFTKFSFATGATTTSETEWDIAFRGLVIALNGGVQTGTLDEPARNGDAGAAIATGTFASVTDAAVYTFLQDAAASFAIPTGSDNGWYNYSGPPNFIVSPIPGRVLVIRTHDGKYAKVELLSYYKDAPAEPNGLENEARFYTFNYVYNPNEGETNF